MVDLLCDELLVVDPGPHRSTVSNRLEGLLLLLLHPILRKLLLLLHSILWELLVLHAILRSHLRELLLHSILRKLLLLHHSIHWLLIELVRCHWLGAVLILIPHWLALTRRCHLIGWKGPGSILYLRLGHHLKS